MNNLKEYLNSKGNYSIPSVKYLESIVEDYPWFAMGHKLLSRASGKITPHSALLLYANKPPLFFNKEYLLDEEVVEKDLVVVEERAVDLNEIVVEIEKRVVSENIEEKLLNLDSKKQVITENKENLSKEDILEKFLLSGNHKIVPKDDVPEFIESIEVGKGAYSNKITISELVKNQSSIEFVPEDDDEFLTEELAEIYTDQELFKQANEIYSRLMLIYPEKSVYFVGILKDLEKQIEKIN